MSAADDAAHLQARMRALPPDSQRHRTLAEACNFKAAWVKLAAALTEVLEAQAFAGWGFASFEDYCRQELHLRPDTAAKLTRSYAFVRERRPAALAADAAPPLEVVDLLSQARGRTRVDERALAEMESQVLAGDAPLSRGQVLRRLRQQDPDAFRAAAQVAPAPAEAPVPAPAPVDAAALRKTLALAERLVVLLDEQGFGGDAVGHAQAVVRALKGKIGPARPRLSA